MQALAKLPAPRPGRMHAGDSEAAATAKGGMMRADTAFYTQQCAERQQARRARGRRWMGVVLILALVVMVVFVSYVRVP